MTKNKNIYFGTIEEDAVIKYLSSTSHLERTRLYIEILEPAFSEMVDKIIFTYKFISIPNIDCLREDCKIWLTTILDKYDPNRGKKAFSYFSVITRNWFFHQAKKNAKQIRKEIEYGELTGELELQHISTPHQYIAKREREEFRELLMEEIKSWDDGTLKENEKKVLDAIKILIESIDDIEIFNKKAFYLYLREITGLNTKQVVGSLNKLRSKYGFFKKRWNDKGE